MISDDSSPFALVADLRRREADGDVAGAIETVWRALEAARKAAGSRSASPR